MLLEVLTKVATDTGLDLISQRNRLIDLANRASKEMYDRLECNKIYWERTVLVPGNKIITLPSYVGELRGMRTSISEMPFDIFGLSAPRYVKKNWEYKWMNWRDMGESPVSQMPSLIAPLSITCTPEATTVTLLISGQTNKATRLEEKIILNSDIKTTVNMFGPQIYSIACLNPNRTSDIMVTDQNGIILGVLSNLDNNTRYKMIDVSAFGWPIDEGDGNNSFIDILYKVPLRKLTQDTDQFPAGNDYDNAWYYGCMWQYYLNSQNKGQDAATWLANMLTALNAAKDGSEQQLVEKLEYGRNKYHDAIRNSTSTDDLHQGNGKPNGWPYFGSWETF